MTSSWEGNGSPGLLFLIIKSGFSDSIFKDVVKPSLNDLNIYMIFLLIHSTAHIITKKHKNINHYTYVILHEHIYYCISRARCKTMKKSSLSQWHITHHHVNRIFNPKRAGLILIQAQTLVSTVSADGSAPNSARPSMGTTLWPKI